MTKHARRPEIAGLPGIEHCLFHRCERHGGVIQLDRSEETGSECGACLFEMTAALQAVQLLILDGYADRLAYSHRQKQKLESARARLNMLSPGAGDFLDETEENEADRDD